VVTIGPTRAGKRRGVQEDPDDRLHVIIRGDGPQTARCLFPAVRDKHRFRVFVVRHTFIVDTPPGAGNDLYTLLTGRRRFLTHLMRASHLRQTRI
jgi:hypothetical protein